MKRAFQTVIILAALLVLSSPRADAANQALIIGGFSPDQDSIGKTDRSGKQGQRLFIDNR